MFASGTFLLASHLLASHSCYAYMLGIAIDISLVRRHRDNHKSTSLVDWRFMSSSITTYLLYLPTKTIEVFLASALDIPMFWSSKEMTKSIPVELNLLWWGAINNMAKHLFELNMDGCEGQNTHLLTCKWKHENCMTAPWSSFVDGDWKLYWPKW